METGKKEAVFVPQDGAFEAKWMESVFKGTPGRAFRFGPGKSNAWPL